VDTVATADQSQKINLNTGTAEQFMTIPGMTDRMVHEFEEYRPYVSIQQFRREIGKYVDEEQVAAYEEYVYVPVNPNESDAETLRQIPGVDETEAAELVAGRPYASSEAFLERLGGYVSADELATAETYIAEQ
jgi:DNA uptake protein ComE-like DNA-binding protein